jgi:hypothetical protein
MSDHVQEGRVPAGSIFSCTGPDDPDPIVLWEQGDDKLVQFNVLAMRKGKSISEDGELVLFAYDDPEAPSDAWVTYNYMVAVPSEADDMPYKLLLTRTGKPAAQQINTVLAKNAAAGPPHTLAFTIDCVQRENKKGKYYVPRVKPVDSSKADVEIAAKLASLVNTPQVQVTEPSVDEPAI